MKNWDKIQHYCYTRLYNNSTPKAKWKDLLANAQINDLGQKVIPYLDYEITQSKLDKIIKATIKKFKIPKHKQQMFRNTIYLGCSPKTKKE